MNIKLTKIKELDDAVHPNNIQEGKVYKGQLKEPPKVGECVYIDRQHGYFRTSIVTEIIDDNTFRTMNSIYKIEHISS